MKQKNVDSSIVNCWNAIVFWCISVNFKEYIIEKAVVTIEHPAKAEMVKWTCYCSQV